MPLNDVTSLLLLKCLFCRSIINSKYILFSFKKTLITFCLVKVPLTKAEKHSLKLIFFNLIIDLLNFF